MALIRHCDICNASISVLYTADSKYIKLHAKEYGSPKETLRKGDLFNYDMCDKCFENISRIIKNYIRQEEIKRVVE